MLIKSNPFIKHIANNKLRGWGEKLCFIYVFVMMHTVVSTSCLSTSNSCCVHVAENVKQRPLWSHFSVVRRIRCNTSVLYNIITYIYHISPDQHNGYVRETYERTLTTFVNAINTVQSDCMIGIYLFRVVVDIIYFLVNKCQ